MGLTFFQKEAVEKGGLSPEEVTGLGMFQLMALEKLKINGLTNGHLKAWSGDDFSVSHVVCLEYLMGSYKLTPEKSMEEINNLSAKQATNLYMKGTRPDGSLVTASEIVELALKEVQLNNHAPSHNEACHQAGTSYSHARPLT